MKMKIESYKPTWNEIVMIVIFLIVMLNGTWNLYIK